MNVHNVKATHGINQLFFKGRCCCSLKIVSPQKQLKKKRSNEYSTNKPEIINTASVIYEPLAIAPWLMSNFPINPENGGIPASDNIAKKNSQPRIGKIPTTTLILSIPPYLVRFIYVHA